MGSSWVLGPGIGEQRFVDGIIGCRSVKFQSVWSSIHERCSAELSQSDVSRFSVNNTIGSTGNVGAIDADVCTWVRFVDCIIGFRPVKSQSMGSRR